jgi:hypothetical protein
LIPRLNFDAHGSHQGTRGKVNPQLLLQSAAPWVQHFWIYRGGGWLDRASGPVM